MRLEHITPIYYYSRTFNVIIDQDYWKRKDSEFLEHVLIWYTDSPRTGSWTGSGICGLTPNSRLSFSLGKFAKEKKKKIYAILQNACENIRRAYRSKRILSISDSQAALRALSGPKITSRLVAECVDALSELAGLNEVTLVWVPSHCGIFGKKEADKLARQASAKPLLGP
jgi:hypothetical protein